jgi:hypothetical protein
MKRLALTVLWLTLLGSAACAAGVKVVPSGSGVTAPARPPDCALELLRKAPDRPHDELAELTAHVTAMPAGGALEVVRRQACALGADAFVVDREQVLNEFGHTLVSGTAIRFGPLPPPPPPAATPEPKPQVPPEQLQD